MSLDILTRKGRVAADDQVVAANTILANRPPGTTFIHTALDDSAAVDGFFVREGEIRAAAEIKCRYNCTVESFFADWRGEWLVTSQKIEDLRLVCSLLAIPGYGVLYIVKSGCVLMIQLFDKTGKERLQWKNEETRTQRTCNGGEATRLNSFIPMHTATRYTIPCQT